MEIIKVKKYTPGDNPILKVDGKIFPYCPCAPGGFRYHIQDISAKDANRTEDEDITMHKKRIGQVDEITLVFKGKTFEETHDILDFFQNEYVMVEFANPLAGGYVTKQMYVGDRTADMDYGGKDIWGQIVIPLKSRKGGMKNYQKEEL